MNEAVTFNLPPCPRCHESALDKSRPATDILNMVGKLLPGTKLTRQPRLPGIFAYTCQRDALTTFGKGFCDNQARASALMEHWERHIWENYPFASQENYRQATFAEMFVAGQSLVNAVYFLQNLEEPQRWAHYLPLLGQIPLHWLPAWSFTAQQILYYPVNWHNICYTSNGLAAGATVAEALLQGLCEVVERENLWRWLADGQPAPTVAPASISDPNCRDLLNRAGELGVELIIRDTSLVAGLPCYSVYGRFHTPSGPKFHFSAAGHGCHPRPEMALQRALSEYLASHTINAGQAGSSMGIWQNDLPAMPPATIREIDWEILDPGKNEVSLPQTSPFMDDDLTVSFQRICDTLAENGYHVGARLLNPGGDLPVVRVIVPNMRALFGTETDDFRMILAQAAHEGGQTEQSVSWLIESMRDPNSSLCRQLGSDPWLVRFLPTIINHLDSSLFFGRDYQETFRRFDTLEISPTLFLEKLLPQLMKRH